MPRYYFGLFDGASVMPDMEGTELPDLEAARHEATKDIEHLRQPQNFGRRNWAKWNVQVTNEAGAVLLRLPFCR